MKSLTIQESDWIRDKHWNDYDRAVFLNRPSVMLGLKPYLDGDNYCVLLGADIQSGVCGFGRTPDEAMQNFDVAWYEPYKKER